MGIITSDSMAMNNQNLSKG